MTRILYKRWLLFVILLFAGWFKTYAVIEHFYNNREGVHFAADSSLTVKDDKYGTSLWSKIVKNALATDVVTIQLDEDTALFLSTSHSLSVDVEITWTQANGTVDSMAKTLNISFDTAKGRAFNFRSSFRFNGGYIVKTRILTVRYDGSISTSFPKVFMLSEDIYITRYYKFNCDSLVSSFTPSYNSTYQRLDLNWTPMLGADEYDVEYNFYDSASAFIRGYSATFTYSDYGFLFNNNATRVTVSGSFVDLSLVYNHGWIFTRIRPVNYDSSGNRITGQWSTNYGMPTQESLFFAAYGYYWAGHMPTLNWQYTAAYAEEGKRKEVSSYFDGTLRSRQSVTINNTENKAIVGETMYDHQGRPALTTLPGPLDTGKLYFYNKYNLISPGVEYSRHDFDTLGCGFIPPPMDSLTTGSVERGSSGYYSSSNPDKANGFNAYLPDAQGYPFMQTEYTLDNTGRIARQSIADKTYTLGSGHETKYAYGKPSQQQLDRLFGNEVGDFSHYLENMVIDANGQISISFIDPNGRTVATALAGQYPLNTQPLPSYHPDSMLYINLLDAGVYNLNPTTQFASYSLLAEYTGRYYFSYKLYPGNYSDNTCASNVCTDCLYDITLMVSDNCGGDNPLILHHDTNFTYASSHPFDTLCSHQNVLDTFSVVLTAGQEYNISRSIAIDPGALSFYEAYNLRHNTCLKSYSSFLSNAIANTDFGGCGESCSQCLAALGTSSAFLTKYIAELRSAGEVTPTHADTANADTAYNQAKANCSLLCAVPSQCADLYAEMLSDVSLGGQYLDYSINVYGKDTATDTASFLWNGLYKTPCSPYLNSAGQHDTVVINGVKYLPTQLSENEFVQHWNPSWASSLVCDHPEYCYYTYCQLDTASNRFDAAMEDSSTYLGAWNAGFINPLGDSSYPGYGAGNYYKINWEDPYFRGGQGSALLHNMFRRMRHYLIIDSSGTNISLSMWEVAALEAYCSEDTLSGINLSHCFPSPGFTSGCTGNQNMNWQLFRGLYMSLKQQVQDSLENIYVAGHGCNTHAECIGLGTCASPWDRKIPRNISETYAATKNYMPSSITKASELSWYNANVKSDCDSMCKAEAYSWYFALKGCTALNSGDSSALIRGFIQVCDSGCNPTHPFGASTMPHWRADSAGDHSFEDVIYRVLHTTKSNLSCDSLNINMPPPYADSTGITGPQVTYYKPDTCVCNKLTYYYETYYYPDSISGDTYYKNYADYLSKTLGGSMTESQLYTLMNLCSSSTCFYLATPMQLPNWLNCCGNDTFHITVPKNEDLDTTAHFTVTHCCINCSDIEGAMRLFYFNANLDDTLRNYQTLVTNYLNQTFNFDLTYSQYINFYNQCKDSTIITNPTLPSCFTCSSCTEKLVPSMALTLCNEPLNTVPPAVDTNPCYTYLMMDAQANAQNAYNNYIDSVDTHFTANYINHCMNIDDSFHLNMPFQEYHYTLYYYDQAGNLVKTVPPQGVHPIYLTASVESSIQSFRLHGGTPTYPVDSLMTRYWYNTLNAPAQQETPDGDTNHFWYDRLGRIVLSQNAIQKPYMFSYTKYDPIGRVIEVGQLNTGTTKIAPGTFMRNDVSLANFIRHWHHVQVTHTYYDSAEYTSIPLAQQNLWKRIATITYEDQDDSNVTTFDNALHYSYDIEGNVVTLLSDNRHEVPVKQEYKRTDYYYDLISGKVNELIYQHDSIDQFMHIYEYDADNRITSVMTSRDSLYFENDADYQYYDHGPLAREVIGQRQVQGLDYAYTVNGWIKGENSSILNPSYDMGQDGRILGANPNIGRDAMGFTLNFFNGDYRAIGGSQFTASGLPITSMYNGNISGATYSMNKLNPKTIGYTYKYDQLNRMVSEKAFKGIDTVGNDWVASDSIKDFKETVQYDENGNILLYIRHGNTIIGSPLAMDSLTYHYNKGKNQLNYVADAVPSANYPNDLHNETLNNYRYNKIGELAKDTDNGLDTITWTAYGKVKKIIKYTHNDSLVYEYDGLGNRIEKRTYNKVFIGTLLVTITDTTLYSYDAQGVLLAVYDRKNDTVKLNEWDMYGDKRIGTVDSNMRLYPKPPIVSGGSLDSSTIAYQEGQKQYELTNHLGNVLVTVSDRKIPIDTTGTPNIANYYIPLIVNAQDYYPFGMVEPGRSYTLNGDSSYRFGMNGMMRDNDIYGMNNAYMTDFRENDPRLGGRWWSIDPKYKAYESPYIGFSDNPILYADPSGADPDANPESPGGNPANSPGSEPLTASLNDYLNGDENPDVKVHKELERNPSLTPIIASGPGGKAPTEDNSQDDNNNGQNGTRDTRGGRTPCNCKDDFPGNDGGGGSGGMKDVKDLHLSDAGFAFIKDYEKFKAYPYLDGAGNATIGYGHLMHFGKITKEDLEKYKGGITEPEAETFLKQDVTNRAEYFVKQYIKRPISQNQYDALVSFTFNEGGKNFGGSTLLKRVNGLSFISKLYDMDNNLRSSFMEYNKAKNSKTQKLEVEGGLTKRRDQEATTYDQGTYNSAH